VKKLRVRSGGEKDCILLTLTLSSVYRTSGLRVSVQKLWVREEEGRLLLLNSTLTHLVS
jgi:hypothetical protein